MDLLAGGRVVGTLPVPAGIAPFEGAGRGSAMKEN
jgi:hypothetical protein